MTSIPGGTSDRELLQWAAKAGGLAIEFHEFHSSDFRSKSERAVIREDAQWKRRITDCKLWSPRTDYSDALQLSVKLRLDIEHGSPLDNSRYVKVSRCGIEMMCDPVSVIEEFEDESGRIDALCLAITRAAAEIGKAMK